MENLLFLQLYKCPIDNNAFSEQNLKNCMSKGNFSNVFTQQHQQKIEELVALAKEQGYITYEEINEILPMSFDSPEQIDQVLIFLSGMDIQVLNQSEVERQKEKKKEAK